MSEHYDSGVDDIKNPKHFIIWSTHMNTHTHIHPKYAMSFKVSTQEQYCVGSKADHCTYSILGTAKHSMLDGPWQQEMVRLSGG